MFGDNRAMVFEEQEKSGAWSALESYGVGELSRNQII